MANRVFHILLIATATLACGGEPPESTESTDVAGEASTAESLPADIAEPDTNPPAIGQKPPDFTLTNHRGEQVTLSEALGQPVVLAFYRGHW